MSKKASAKKSGSDDAVIALALSALREVTGPETFAETPVVVDQGETVSVSFPSTQPGYPGWQWTVSLSNISGADSTVLEVGLLPGTGALVSPDWVPWADRLEEYLLHEKELKDQDSDDEDDDDDTLDVDDDVDGVDIDQLDLDLDPTPLEIPDEPTDVFDHVELDEPDPLDP